MRPTEFYYISGRPKIKEIGKVTQRKKKGSWLERSREKSMRGKVNANCPIEKGILICMCIYTYKVG